MKIQNCITQYSKTFMYDISTRLPDETYRIIEPSINIEDGSLNFVELEKTDDTDINFVASLKYHNNQLKIGSWDGQTMTLPHYLAVHFQQHDGTSGLSLDQIQGFIDRQISLFVFGYGNILNTKQKNFKVIV